MANFSAPLFLQSNPIQEWQKDRVRLELNLDCHLLLILQLIMASFFFFVFFKSFHRFFAFVADCGITDISQRISTVIISCHISLFFFGKDFMSHLITWVFFFFYSRHNSRIKFANTVRIYINKIIITSSF